MSTPEVRPATTEDVDEIVRIHRETWRIAYTELLGADALAALDTEDVRRQWADTVTHPDSIVRVAEENRFTVGFSVCGTAPEDEAAAADGAPPPDADTVGLVSTVLVEPRWGRRGHGGRLLAAAVTGLRESGHDRGIAWVAESDPATLALYRRAGWNPDGTVRTLDTGTGTLRELRLTGSLDLEVE